MVGSSPFNEFGKLGFSNMSNPQRLDSKVIPGTLFKMLVLRLHQSTYAQYNFKYIILYFYAFFQLGSVKFSIKILKF